MGSGCRRWIGCWHTTSTPQGGCTGAQRGVFLGDRSAPLSTPGIWGQWCHLDRGLQGQSIMKREPVTSERPRLQAIPHNGMHTTSCIVIYLPFCSRSTYLLSRTGRACVPMTASTTTCRQDRQHVTVSISSTTDAHSYKGRGFIVAVTLVTWHTYTTISHAAHTHDAAPTTHQANEGWSLCCCACHDFSRIQVNHTGLISQWKFAVLRLALLLRPSPSLLYIPTAVQGGHRMYKSNLVSNWKWPPANCRSWSPPFLSAT